ncbi:hypothetical protein G7Y79_00032g067330 [Physcia stellaris]|nr:hypothetical protein G7Y79_00032g067330 [Physcia stellaris]
MRLNKFGRATMLPALPPLPLHPTPTAEILEVTPRRSTRARKAVRYPTTPLRNGEPVRSNPKSKKIARGKITKKGSAKARMAGEKEGNGGKVTLAMRRGRKVDWIMVPALRERLVEEGVERRGLLGGLMVGVE